MKISVFLLFIAGACYGGLSVVTRPTGLVSTKDYYDNNEMCHWKVQVERKKVKSFCYIYFLKINRFGDSHFSAYLNIT